MQPIAKPLNPSGVICQKI